VQYQIGQGASCISSYKGPHTKHNSRTFPLLLHYGCEEDRPERVSGDIEKTQNIRLSLMPERLLVVTNTKPFPYTRM